VRAVRFVLLWVALEDVGLVLAGSGEVSTCVLLGCWVWWANLVALLYGGDAIIA
jgi:hypothetical protein